MNVLFRNRALGAASVVALAFAVAGCGGDTSTAGTMSMPSSTSTSAATSSTSASSSGTSSSSSPADLSSSSANDSMEHNDADVAFAQRMIVHHQGSVAMADLAPDRAASQQVKDLAAQIKDAQAPEIELMTGWLEAWGAPMTASSGGGTGGMGGMATEMGSMTSSDGMGMGASAMGSSAGMEMPTEMGMPGMMTADQMGALTAASGAAFDKMFLEMMVMHHQGAVQMADTELAQGRNPDALQLANSIKTSQTAEIATMRQLLQAM